jgi:glucoamylase
VAAGDQPGSRPDPTGRRLAYLPAALLGNGDLLATLSARGEVERLMWPHVGGPGNVAELRVAIVGANGDAWLDEEPCEWRQEWAGGDASVLRTTVATPEGRVVIEDALDPEEPVLVRRVEARAGRLAVACIPRLDGDVRLTGAFVDPGSRAVVFHRRDIALALLVDVAVADAGVAPADGAFDDVAHVGPVRGRLEADHDGIAHVVVAFGVSPFEALACARAHSGAPERVAARRRSADAAVLADVAAPVEPDPLVERLVARSVLVLEQLTDRATGGIVAAPEMDDAFAESGGYGFVWPRDLSYVVLGLLAAGRSEPAAAALRWLARVQTPEGLWLHRHWTSGELAPSWGLHQLDETGVAVFAMEAAVAELEDELLDAELWPSIRRGAAFLASFLEPATGLPRASIDIWEQHDGQHAYTAAAVVGGLRAAARAGERHGELEAAAWRAVSDQVAAAIDATLWSEERGRHARAVNVARTGRGVDTPGAAFERALPYPNRRVTGVAAVDATLDCSLLGLAWPFAALDPASRRLHATVAAVESGLAAPGGGLHRQAGDTYAGGHEWPLAVLWLGLVRRMLGDDDSLRGAVAHVASRRTALGLLPEQSDEHGRPAWVLPLGWSHAMLLLAMRPELRLVAELRSRPMHESAGDGRGG